MGKDTFTKLPKAATRDKKSSSAPEIIVDSNELTDYAGDYHSDSGRTSSTASISIATSCTSSLSPSPRYPVDLPARTDAGPEVETSLVQEVDDQLHRDFTRGLLINWQLFATADKQEQNDILREQLNLTPEEIEILMHQYMAELSTIYFKEEKKEAGQIEYEKVDNITAKLQQPDEHAVLKLLSEKFKDPIFCSIEPKFNLYKKDKDSKELFLDIYISAFASIANQQFYPYPGIIKLSFVLDFNAPGLDKKKPGTGFKYLGCKQEVSKEDRSSLAKEDQLLARILTNDPTIASEEDIITIYQESLLDKITHLINIDHPWEYYDETEDKIKLYPIIEDLRSLMHDIAKKNTAYQLDAIIQECKKIKPANSPVLVQQLSKLNYFDLNSILSIDQELDYAHILQLAQKLVGTKEEWSSVPDTYSVHLIGKIINTPHIRKSDLEEQIQLIQLTSSGILTKKDPTSEFDTKLANALYQTLPPNIIMDQKFRGKTSIVKTVSARKRAINLLEELLLVKELTKIIIHDNFWKDDEGNIAKIITDLQTKVKDPKFEQLTSTAQLAVLRDIAKQWPTEGLSKQEDNLRLILTNSHVHIMDPNFNKLIQREQFIKKCETTLEHIEKYIDDDAWWKLFNAGTIPEPIIALRAQLQDENLVKTPLTKILCLHNYAKNELGDKTKRKKIKQSGKYSYDIYKNLTKIFEEDRKEDNNKAIDYAEIVFEFFTSWKRDYMQKYEEFFQYMRKILNTKFNPEPKQLRAMSDLLSSPTFKGRNTAAKIQLLISFVTKTNLAKKDESQKRIKFADSTTKLCRELARLLNPLKKQGPFKYAEIPTEELVDKANSILELNLKYQETHTDPAAIGTAITVGRGWR